MPKKLLKVLTQRFLMEGKQMYPKTCIQRLIVILYNTVGNVHENMIPSCQ